MDILFDSHIDEKIKHIKSAGFDGVVINLNENEAPTETIEAVRQNGLVVQNLHLPYSRINDLWVNGTSGTEMIRGFMKQIEFAHAHKVPIVVLHITSGNIPPLLSEVGIERIKQIIAFCEDHGVLLALENLRRLDYLLEVYDRCESDFLSFCFDIGHANALTGNLYEFPWKNFSSKLCCFHLHDNDGSSDQHLIPFMGNIDWGKIIPYIFSLKKDIPITIETYLLDWSKSFYTNMFSKDNFEAEFFKKTYQAALAIESYLNE